METPCGEVSRRRRRPTRLPKRAHTVASVPQRPRQIARPNATPAGENKQAAGTRGQAPRTQAGKTHPKAGRRKGGGAVAQHARTHAHTHARARTHTHRHAHAHGRARARGR
eukprot:1996067-Alexandrium_andersonii.AAC.1